MSPSDSVPSALNVTRLTIATRPPVGAGGEAPELRDPGADAALVAQRGAGRTDEARREHQPPRALGDAEFAGRPWEHRAERHREAGADGDRPEVCGRRGRALTSEHARRAELDRAQQLPAGRHERGGEQQLGEVAGDERHEAPLERELRRHVVDAQERLVVLLPQKYSHGRPKA